MIYDFALRDGRERNEQPSGRERDANVFLRQGTGDGLLKERATGFAPPTHPLRQGTGDGRAGTQGVTPTSGSPPRNPRGRHVLLRARRARRRI